MSTLFMVTALAEMDLTLCDDTDIGNRICILVATQGDVTPLNPSSFQEESVIELCMGLGQEHPEGVICLSDTEAVLVYQCEPNMLAMTCCLTAAMVWQGEHIRLCMLPPKG